MRSAPTTTQSTRPSDMAVAAAASGRIRYGTPASASSYAVSRAPCSNGRVSSASTYSTSPSAARCHTTPSAVPQATVARRPALQCVSSRSGRRAHSDRISSAARSDASRLTRSSSSSTASASPRTACGPSPSSANARWTPHRRLTAVGRADARRSAWARTVRPVAGILPREERDAERAGARRGPVPPGRPAARSRRSARRRSACAASDSPEAARTGRSRRSCRRPSRSCGPWCAAQRRLSSRSST